MSYFGDRFIMLLSLNYLTPIINVTISKISQLVDYLDEGYAERNDATTNSRVIFLQYTPRKTCFVGRLVSHVRWILLHFEFEYLYIMQYFRKRRV